MEKFSKSAGATQSESVILRELERSSGVLKHRPPYWAYLRVSSEEQRRRKTIEGQRNDTEAWASARGVSFDHVEEDDGHSGATIIGRPAFRRVIEACRRGEVGTLVVTAPDRLTRADDWEDRAAIWTALRAHQTLLVMTGFCEIDPYAETADLLLGQAFTLAAMERRRMRDRSFRGKVRAANNGRLPQGKAPFGRHYDRDTGTWSVVEAEAAIYRRIFAMVLEGRSTNEIPAILNREGVPSPAGRGWSQSYVSDLLRSRAALGEYTTLERKIQIPPIIDVAMFDAVGQVLEANRRYIGRRARHQRLLSGLMVCGACGSGMHVRTCGKPANRQQAYRCGQWHPAHAAKPDFKRPACAEVQHNADAVEDAVWAEVERVLRDPVLLREAAGLGASEGDGRWESEIATAEKDVKALERQTQNLLRLYQKELVPEADLERQLAEVQAQRRAAEQRKATAVAQRDAAAAMKDSMRDLSARVEGLVAKLDAASVEERRELVAAIFPKREPFGLRLHADGRIEAMGALPIPANDDSGEPVDAGDQVRGARRSPGCSSRPRRRSPRGGCAGR